ncbi:unnamed protein product, partial [Symbiodinium sp. CCMP2456]
MTDLPNCLWLSFQNTVIKAAPERVRPATEEENLSLSGWMSGIAQVRKDFEAAPKRGFVDLTKDLDPPEFSGDEQEPQPGTDAGQPPVRRVRRKTGDYEVRPEDDILPDLSGPGANAGLPSVPPEAPMAVEEEAPPAVPLMEPEPNTEDMDLEGTVPGLQDNKRELEAAPEPPGKRSRIELLEAYNLQMQALQRQRQRKESTAKDFQGKDADRLQRAIQKEIRNNLETGAYRLLSLSESEAVLRDKREKVMNSRYVLTKKPLEPSDIAAAQAEDTLLEDDGSGPHKAKCRHAAAEVESTTPQVSRDSVIFVTQVLASMGWDFGYVRSIADPCVFLLHGQGSQSGSLDGIVGVATDDLLHGGTERHWQVIEKIATEYKLGKNQTGTGRFTGKDIKLQEDGSITIDQAFYVSDKVHLIKIGRSRKQQRYSKCTPSEIEQLRSQLGALAWLAKETRCDLSGRVALLQQAFPQPRVADIIEGNKIAEEAHKYATTGIKVMPIPWERLRVSVVTDAAWGNAKDCVWIEDNESDWWEETSESWVRHHAAPRRTAFHPGAAPDGPDLHQLTGHRHTVMFSVPESEEPRKDELTDVWFDSKGIRVLKDQPWTGTTTFKKTTEPGQQ